MAQIYADNAATSRTHPDAVEAMLPYFTKFYGNPSSRHSMSKEPHDALVSSIKTIADCIGADSEEITITSGGTESDNWALRGLLSSEKNHIVVSSIEHPAILNACKVLEKNGIKVTIIPVDGKGHVDLLELEDAIDEHTAVVSIMHGNNEIGTLQDMKAISEIVHRKGSVFHTDAVQTVGKVPIDVKEMGIDLLSSSAHKYNGPRGIGFLYVRKGIDLNPMILGGGQQAGMRSGTENIPGIVGMATALKINCDDLDAKTVRLRIYENRLMTCIRTSKFEHVFNGDAGSGIPGIVSVSFRGIKANDIVDKMNEKGVCISAGSACDAHCTKLSGVLAAIGADPEYASGTVRISFGLFTTPADVDLTCGKLLETLYELND